jgi:hypothetical protein
MPKSTCVEIPQEEHAQTLAALRHTRYGSLLVLLKAALWTYGGAARAGAETPWPRPWRPNAASGCQLRRCGAGCARWAGCGSQPRGWPKPTTRTDAMTRSSIVRNW